MISTTFAKSSCKLSQRLHLTRQIIVLIFAQMDKGLRQLAWIASAKKDYAKLSEQIHSEVGYAIYEAQLGHKHPSAKVLKGFGGADVLEIVADDAGGTYRVVYAVRFAGVLYVLHVFQKKSTKGISTPKHEIDLIKKRLQMARDDYQEHKHEYEE